MSLKATLQAEVKKFRFWAKAALLMGLEYADDIVSFSKDHLGELQVYLPDNVYKFMGGTVVILSLVLGFIATHRDKKKEARDVA